MNSCILLTTSAVVWLVALSTEALFHLLNCEEHSTNTLKMVANMTHAAVLCHYTSCLLHLLASDMRLEPRKDTATEPPSTQKLPVVSKVGIREYDPYIKYSLIPY